MDKRKIVSLALCIVMVFTLSASAFAVEAAEKPAVQAVAAVKLVPAEGMPGYMLSTSAMYDIYGNFNTLFNSQQGTSVRVYSEPEPRTFEHLGSTMYRYIKSEEGILGYAIESRIAW